MWRSIRASLSGQQLPHQAVEGLDEGAVGRVAVVLIELAAEVIALLARQRLRDLLHERGLADARVPRDEDDLALAIEHAVEGRDERGDVPSRP